MSILSHSLTPNCFIFPFPQAYLALSLPLFPLSFPLFPLSTFHFNEMYFYRQSESTGLTDPSPNVCSFSAPLTVQHKTKQSSHPQRQKISDFALTLFVLFSASTFSFCTKQSRNSQRIGTQIKGK